LEFSYYKIKAFEKAFQC